MKKASHILFASWLIISGSAGSPTPCFANTAVTVKPDVEITRMNVKLSDIFSGVPSEIDRDIAQAPLACKPALYNEAVLNKLAETYRLDWQSPGSPDHVMITSACTKIGKDALKEAVVSKIKTAGSAKRLDYEVSFDTRNLEIDLPTDQQPDFSLENFSFDPVNKQFRTDFTAQTPRGPYVLPLTGHVLIKHQVPILAHRLENGSKISAEDLDWIQVPEERITAEVITEPEQLIGRELRRDTAEGEILHSHDVMPPRLIQKGSLVTMKIETPFIVVTAQGKAEQDGAQGDTVRVLNTQSNRIVEGVVVAPGVVEIHVARQVALAE